MAETTDTHEDVEAIARIPAVQTILEVVSLITGMRIAVVARVTDTKWVACAVHDTAGFGLRPGGALKVETTLCSAIREDRQPVLVEHVAEDPRFCDHPTPALYGFQSYISFPIIRADGTMFGTLCAIDPGPAKMDTLQVRGMFEKFTALIAGQLEVDRKDQIRDAVVLDERRTAELREQFIAVLGHDLRNPLSAIGGGVEVISRTPLNDKAKAIVPMVRASIMRMAGMIDNVLDFARGRLGDGLTLARKPADLDKAIRHVVAELLSGHVGIQIEMEIALPPLVDCDPSRVSQLLSNLVANALTHGTTTSPVMVRAIVEHGFLDLSVANGGEPIPAVALARLFQPFERGAVRPSLQGLGLGLYISSQIAKAHGGALAATSTPDETRFTFRMPLVAP